MKITAFAAALLLAWAGAAGAETDQRRNVILTDGRTSGAPAPLVLALHGFTGTGASLQRKTIFDTLALRDGFIVAYPSGQRRRWNDGARTDGTADDQGHLTALIDNLVATGRADPKRIFIVGYSNGGSMALHMACARPDLIAGIVMVAMTAPRAAPCANGTPVPAFFIHGMKDRIVPPAGQPPRGSFGGSLSLSQTLALWAKRNRCTKSPDTAPLTPQSKSTYDTYRGCAAPLYAVRLADNGHRWPGSRRSPLLLKSPNSTTALRRFDAADISWRFFSAL